MEGEVTVKFKACDKAVNCSNDKVVKTRLDRTAPNKPTLDMTHSYNKNKSNGYKATVYSNNTWINNNIYMTDARTVLANGKFQGPKATDVTPRNGVVISGVSKYQISSNNTQWEDYSYDSDRELYRITKEGVSKRYIRTVDKAGNLSASTTFTLKLDKTDPSCDSYKFNRYSRYGVSVNVSCSDSRSGCSGYNEGNHYNVYSSDYWTVYDNAGNSCTTYETVYSRSQCDWVNEFWYSQKMAGRLCDSAGDVTIIPGNRCGIYSGERPWGSVIHHENCTSAYDSSSDAYYRCCCDWYKDIYHDVCYPYTEYY